METIAAIATARGAGGIAIVRISGPQAKALGHAVFHPAASSFVDFRPWVLHRGYFVDEGTRLDDILLAFMPGPRTFTGEDVVEIHCHGGAFLVQMILEAVLRHGARLAERGEFTRRAFLNGRMDLSQAEAVAEMIAAPSREAVRYSFTRLQGELGRRVTALHDALLELRVQACLAVDFPDEEVECLDPTAFDTVAATVEQDITALLAGCRRARVMQEGAPVVLAGNVNAGKSSLMNVLLGRSRALVTDIPGTTRDFLEEFFDIDGVPVRLIDTAGLRESQDTVESLGIAVSKEKVQQADAILLVLDGAALGEAGALAETCPDSAAQETLRLAGDIPVLLVWNKVDSVRPQTFPPRWADQRPCLAISAKTGEGIDSLATTLRHMLLDDAASPLPEEGIAPNARQTLALEEALSEIQALRHDIQAGQSYDCLSVRLDAAVAALADVTGKESPEEVLNKVFSSFCIGK